MPASTTYDTSNPGSATGNREDLANFVTTLAPDKTPVLSLCSRDKAEAVSFGWMVDVLGAPTITGYYENEDQTDFDDQFAGRARLTNNIVELRESYSVSDWQEAVNSVGPADLAAAKVKAVKRLRRSLEANLCGTQDKADPAPGVKSQSRGLGDWIDSAGPSDVPADFRTPSGSIHSSGALTETIFKDIITSIYRQDGMDQSLNFVADTAARRVVTGFAESTGSTNTTSRQVVQDADGRLRSTVSYYESDHGVVRVLNMNPVCAPDTTDKDTGYFIPDGALALKELIPMYAEDMPRQGGGSKGVVKWVGGLVVKSPAMFGKITDVTA